MRDSWYGFLTPFDLAMLNTVVCVSACVVASVIISKFVRAARLIEEKRRLFVIVVQFLFHGQPPFVCVAFKCFAPFHTWPTGPGQIEPYRAMCGAGCRECSAFVACSLSFACKSAQSAQIDRWRGAARVTHTFLPAP